jgi:extracellular factor (EF) 3-hydroxypalmitic acid methyl ester biosynthesis protein
MNDELITAQDPVTPARLACHAPGAAPRPPVAAAAAALTLEENTQALLDRAAGQVLDGQAAAAFRLLTPPLSALWSEARATGRADAMRQWCQTHPLHALVIQDPFTQRAVAKPRGYAGDAVMMDFIYDGEPPAGTSAIGADVFRATTRAGMGLSVRYRRQLLQSLIDDTVVRHERPRLLSVAAGHCRELQGSLVESAGFGGEFVALDQDLLSCQEIARAHAGHAVRVVNQGVRELAGSSQGSVLADALGGFDLIYSAGLYDYLPDALARRLTRRLLAMLRPGGRLLVANFVPGGTGRGYMELFMDWTLVLRSEAQMRELAAAAGAAHASTFADPQRNVVYAELWREVPEAV